MRGAWRRDRERGSIVVDLAVDDGRRRFRWPTEADLTLTVESTDWAGLEVGHGVLTDRRLRVGADGRRGAARARRVELSLGPTGALSAIGPANDPTVVETPAVAAVPSGRHLRAV